MSPDCRPGSRGLRFFPPSHGTRTGSHPRRTRPWPRDLQPADLVGRPRTPRRAGRFAHRRRLNVRQRHQVRHRRRSRKLAVDRPDSAMENHLAQRPSRRRAHSRNRRRSRPPQRSSRCPASAPVGATSRTLNRRRQHRRVLRQARQRPRRPRRPARTFRTPSRHLLRRSRDLYSLEHCRPRRSCRCSPRKGRLKRSLTSSTRSLRHNPHRGRRLRPVHRPGPP